MNIGAEKRIGNLDKVAQGLLSMWVFRAIFKTASAGLEVKKYL